MVWKSQDSGLGGREKKTLNSLFLKNQAMSEMVSFKKSQFSPLSGEEKSTRKLAYNVTGIHKITERK